MTAFMKFDKHCEEFNKIYDQLVIEALEIAFQEIDNENDKHKSLKNSPKLIKDFDEILTIENDPIYENLDEILKDEPPPRVKIEPKSQPKTTALPKKSILKTRSVEKPERVVEESHYQVPTSEPYYEVPKTKPVPLYENFEMFGAASPMTLENKVLEPPKEKPPPPPVEVASDEHELAESEESEEPQAQFSQTEDVFKRVNSTKRIKKEIRSKRSSFLGIEGGDDDSFLEINVAPPPNMAVFLEEERRLQRQLLRKTGFSDSSDAGESRDSGVSENHSRQSSGPYSSEENDEKLHGQELVPSAVDSNIQELESAARLRTIEKQIRDQEEVLRVERELLQLEEEELKRQRESMIYHEKLARSDLNHGAKMLKSANRMSAHEQSNGGLQHYSNLHYPHQHQAYQIETDYRKSMPDLQSIMDQKRMLPIPPAKPLRAQFHQDYININSLACMTPNSEHHETSNYGIAQPRLPPTQEDFYQIRNTPLHHMPQMRTQSCTSSNNNHNQYANMSKQTLHVLSATPKPKLTNDWVRRSDYSQDLYQEQDLYRKRDPYLRHHNVSRNSDTWAQNQQKRRSDPQGFSYNSHWLIQEAEQRRLEQQRNDRNVAQKKPLPDSVIQTITQRVQSLGLGERLRRPIETPMSVSNGDLSNLHNEQERVLSVSGKKRCSHCNNELGRGAAMIIESLRLFYHIDCFKCSVCHASLGDGLGGTDVRVRNSKLHCQNCYSSDDGIKFSCV